MRSSAGGIAVAVVALLLGVLTVSQFRSQDVYSRNLQLETPESLTTLVANLAARNNALRDEILDLRLSVNSAQDSIAGGRGPLAEAERQLRQLRVMTAQSAVRGPGVVVIVDGQFDDRALSDLVNELRNAGAEAIAINDVRVGPRSHFGAAPAALMIDGAAVRLPLTVRAIGSADVIHVALTRTGGIISQFGLIYPRTRFAVSKETDLALPPVAGSTGRSAP